MQKKLKRLFLSDLMLDATNTQRIAYVGIMTALLVVCNMFFEFKLADTQFSLTIFFSAMAGIIIGPIFGFVACFLGDLVGFLYNSGGFTYMPWIGRSMALVAFISAIVVNGFYFKFKGGVFVKLAIVSFLTFLLCTVAINTTCFWIVYNTKKVPFFAYLITRLFVQGQIWNSLFNYGLLFVLFPLWSMRLFSSCVVFGYCWKHCIQRKTSTNDKAQGLGCGFQLMKYAGSLKIKIKDSCFYL